MLAASSLSQRALTYLGLAWGWLVAWSGWRGPLGLVLARMPVPQERVMRTAAIKGGRVAYNDNSFPAPSHLAPVATRLNRYCKLDLHRQFPIPQRRVFLIPTTTTTTRKKQTPTSLPPKCVPPSSSPPWLLPLLRLRYVAFFCIAKFPMIWF